MSVTSEDFLQNFIFLPPHPAPPQLRSSPCPWSESFGCEIQGMWQSLRQPKFWRPGSRPSGRYSKVWGCLPVLCGEEGALPQTLPTHLHSQVREGRWKASSFSPFYRCKIEMGAALVRASNTEATARGTKRSGDSPLFTKGREGLVRMKVVPRD